ncbi:MAG: 4Fe-4S binding protein [Desulfosalsimonas sp.]
MGEFVRISVDEDKCGGADKARSLVDVCAVGVFEIKNGELRVVEENEDECTFCDRCMEICPNGGVKIIKLYEQ